MKYYAVRKGYTTGIFTSWAECESKVKGYPGAEYKSFSLEKDAEEYLNNMENKKSIETPCNNYAFVDGSYNAETDTYGYGGFIVINNFKFILQGSGNNPELSTMRNVAGEIEGAKAAIQAALNSGLKTLSIYYDYQGIESWANGEWKANKPGTCEYVDFCRQARLNGLSIKFIKIKGHSGVAGNEEADKLAKQSVGIL